MLEGLLRTLLMTVSLGAICYGIYWGSTTLSNKMEKKELQAKLDRELMVEKHKQMLERQKSSVNVNITGAAAGAPMSEAGAKLALAQVKCIQCGASIEPGMKFCGHCGTQVPDNVQRTEIKIEDQAELERVAYEREVHQRQMAIEEKEAKIREVRAKKALHRDRNRWIVRGVLAGISGLIVLIATVTGNTTTHTTFGVVTLFAYLVLIGVVVDIIFTWFKKLIG